MLVFRAMRGLDHSGAFHSKAKKLVKIIPDPYGKMQKRAGMIAKQMAKYGIAI